MDPRRPPQGIPGFTPGFAPGTFKKMFIYFTVPIAIGFGLINITNRWNDPINEEVKNSNPRMVPIIAADSKAMFSRVQEDNKKFLEEFWGKKAEDNKGKDEKK